MSLDPTLRQFQQQIERLYLARDAERGVDRTFVWFAEEVGELARALLTEAPGSAAEQSEFADCLAWLATLASLRGVDLAEACWHKYGTGCPRCRTTPCTCRHRVDSDPTSA